MERKERLLTLLDMRMNPAAHGESEAQADEVLLQFCAGCPDPLAAHWLVVECLEPMSDEELIERALAMPARKLADVNASDLPLNHPLRRLAR